MGNETNERQDVGRERIEVVQYSGDEEFYDFGYTAKYGTGSNWTGDYELLIEDLPELTERSMRECLDFFEKSHNAVFKNLRIGNSSRLEKVRFSISSVMYGKELWSEDVELTFNEYLKLGCPDKIHVDKHISVSKGSLEGEVEREVMKGGKE